MIVAPVEGFPQYKHYFCFTTHSYWEETTRHYSEGVSCCDLTELVHCQDIISSSRQTQVPTYVQWPSQCNSPILDTSYYDWFLHCSLSHHHENIVFFWWFHRPIRTVLEKRRCHRTIKRKVTDINSPRTIKVIRTSFINRKTKRMRLMLYSRCSCVKKK